MRKLLCAGVSLPLGTKSAVWYEIHDGRQKNGSVHVHNPTRKRS